MKSRLLLLEYDLMSPGRGLGRLELCTIFAAFIKSGVRSHFYVLLLPVVRRIIQQSVQSPLYGCFGSSSDVGCHKPDFQVCFLVGLMMDSGKGRGSLPFERFWSR